MSLKAICDGCGSADGVMQFEEGFDYCGTCMPRVRSFVDDINELRADTARMLVKMFGAIRRNYPDVKIVPLPQGPFEL